MAAKSLHIHLFLHLRRSDPISTTSFRLPQLHINPTLFSPQFFSTTATRYPLQYEMIISRPANKPLPRRQRRPPAALPNSQPEPELGFDEWVDKKLSTKNGKIGDDPVMDKAQRKYFNKRRKRMYGESESDGEDSGRRGEGDFVELKQEVVELRTLHKREEELYFYDAFAYPWEKNKHYKMVYQMEKKYFPDQCFDKAFLEPGRPNAKRREKFVEEEENRGLVFFDESDEKNKEEVKVEDVTEKKVEDFFKCLKKFPNEKGGDVVAAEPFFSSRSVGLPPKWDGPYGTVVLINKPKGWTSFTVCGKLRRLVNVKKVGHAGTLDPMATGFLIVCVGKATKQVDRYQGMIKGYSGIFRLGEATSTWDADSPVCITTTTTTKPVIPINWGRLYEPNKNHV